MFANLKLKNRLLLGYSVPILLCFGLVGLIYTSTSKLSDRLIKLEQSEEISDIANTMTLSHARMVEGVRGYLLFQNKQLLSEYAAGSSSFDAAAKRARDTIEDLNQQQRVREMIRLKERYHQFFQRILKLSNEGKTAEALSLFRTGEGKRYIEQFRIASAQLYPAQKENIKTTTAEAKTAIANLITIVLIGALLCFIFSMLAAFLLSSSIAKTIDRTARAIAAASTEIAATVEQQERTAAQQATAVHQTTTTMDELGASSKATAFQAETAAADAKTALSLAAGGTEAVEETLDGMSELKQKVSAIAREILRLSEQTNQIGTISNLVSDLANQTNLLALNAAVEAVRAGEHGKGFGVVASEIRKLADRSKKSAEKINTLVIDIQTAINSTVMVTDEGTKTVADGVKIAQKTADAFTGVTAAINNVVISSQQISLSAKQQAIAIQQVVDAMNALNQAAAQSASGISQAKVGTQNLNEAAQSLKIII